MLSASIGSATTLLELAATSIGYGIVAVGFVTSCVGMLLGWTRKDLEADALRSAFWGGFFGTLCLCIDLLLSYPGIP